jgi:hypothetical protein
MTEVGYKAREYGDNSMQIDEITIATLTPPQDVMGSSIPRSIEQANNKWHIVNPDSRFNCVWQSLAVCKNFLTNRSLLEDSKKRIKAGGNLKDQVKKVYKDVDDNFVEKQTIQQICNYTRYPIHLYNNVFELIEKFTPRPHPLKRYKGKIKHYDIQRVGDHCLALIDKKMIKEKYPDFDFNILEKKESTVQSKNVKILRKWAPYDYNHKIAAWDVETSKNRKNIHIPYACSIAWFDYDFGEDIVTEYQKKIKKGVYKTAQKRRKNILDSSIKEQQFWGLDCLQQMTRFIHENKHIFRGYTLYAHNGGKYDLPLAIKKAFIDSDEFVIEGKGCIEQANAWIGFTLRAKEDRQFKLYFRDSFKLLPMPLKKLAKELKV